ncbi:AAA family ATPase [Oceanivirga salmonicida]|uniref:AAA family ATPase n=1 Tax=Oceanivirga salmonicida TaxID=1769291 RepID=UPI0018CC318B|nr:AAA family ATPase [Oceanivirga salmonicida]
MLNEVVGIELKGANFSLDTKLNLLKKSNNNLIKGSLVYGRNGTGKSTISKAFKKVSGQEITILEKAQLFNESVENIDLEYLEKKSIFVFDEDFIHNNVKIKTNGLGSIVMLGENADLTVKIDEAKKEEEKAKNKQDEIQLKINEFKDKNNVKSPDYYINKMRNVLKKDDGWAGRERKIKDLRINAGVSDKTYLKFKELNPIKSKSELLVEFEEKMNELESAKQGSNKIISQLLKIPNSYKAFDYVNANELLKESIEKPKLSEREKYLLSLVENGEKELLEKQMEFFVNSDTGYCPYCLQDVEENYKNNLVNKIKSILSEEVKIHCDKLSKFIIDEIYFDFVPFEELDSNEKSIELLNEINLLIQENNKKIEKKRNSPFNSIKEEVVDIKPKIIELEKILEQMEKEKANYNSNVVNTEPIVDNLSEINNEIAYYDIIDYSKQHDVQILEYQKLQDEKSEADNIVESKTKSITALKAKLKNIDIAVELINKSLKYIFFTKGRLEIKVENDIYCLLSNGEEVLPNNISVGERNIIGLCYFFASMFEGESTETALKKEHLIVIDDPISSYDFENKIGILSFLKLKLSQILTGNQESKAIILTHDLLTFFDIEKIFEEIQKECRDCFDKKIVFNLFELKNCKLNEFKYKKRHEYTEMLKIIYDYAHGSKEEYSLTIGNIMRQVLEAFSTFEYKKGIADISTDKDILNKMDEDYQLYFKNLMYRLLLNGGSHKEELTRSLKLDFFAVISDEEKVRTAKDIICFIYLINNLHLISHIADDKDKLDYVKNELDSWCHEIKNL